MASESNAKSKTTTVHVGVGRYQSLTATAIEVSHKTGSIVSPSQVLHFIIDHHLVLVEEMLIRHLTKTLD